MQFKEVIGQEDVKRRLVESVHKHRISHGQLFAGPEGNGKLALALAYATFISCANRSDNDSCGECPSCRKYQKFVHPDLHFVFPVVTSTKFKSPVSDNYLTEWREFLASEKYHSFDEWLAKIATANQQGSIFAHESQEIIRKLNLKTYEAEYKIMIIWMPERMNVVSANKLLKILEEPPEKTLFLMVSSNPEELLTTIISRTQLIKIPRIGDDELKRTLKQSHQVTDEQLGIAIRYANGNYLKAVEALNESVSSSANFERFTNLMRLCYGYKVIEANAWVDEISKEGREYQKNFLSYSLTLLRENFVLNQMGNNLGELNFLTGKEIDFSKKFSNFINDRNIFQLQEEFNKAYYHIERNANNKLVFFDLCLQIMKLLRK